MNSYDWNRILLKAFGIALLLLAVVKIPGALSGTIAFAYWGTLSLRDAGDFEETVLRTVMANQALEGLKGILGFLFLGWFSIQVLKERPWILRFTRIGTAEPGEARNAGKAPGDERSP